MAALALLSPRAGYEGRRGAMRDSGLRKVAGFIPDGRHIKTSNRASRGDSYYKNCIRVRPRVESQVAEQFVLLDVRPVI